MKSSNAALVLLATVACCVAADGPIKADNSAATVDLGPTSSRNLLTGTGLGTKTNETKTTAKDATMEPAYCSRIVATTTNATATGRRLLAHCGRRLLNGDEAAARNLLTLGSKTNQTTTKDAVMEPAYCSRIVATATNATAAGRRLLAHCGRRLLNGDEAAARNLLTLGTKTNETKTTAKDAVMEPTYCSRMVATTTNATATGRRLLAHCGRRLLNGDEAAARKLLILGYRTHEAENAATQQVKANANPGIAKGDKAAAKAVTAQNTGLE